MMGINAKFWNADEDAAIANLELTAREAATLTPQRTESAVKNRRTMLGLNRITNRRRWSDDEISHIKSSTKTDYALSKDFGVTGSSIKAVRRRAGAPKVHHCVECGEEIGANGKYCNAHRKLGKQITYYQRRSAERGGGLTSRQISNLLKDNCHYCGREKAMGIDRINSAKGYTEANAVSCCSRCNTMKMDMPIDEWFSQMKRILEHQNGH